MAFSEFVKHSPTVINKLLMIKGHYMNTTIRSNTGFEIVDETFIDDLLKEDIYNYGSFCWVDYDIQENIENFSPAEIAELLYLGHMFKPLKSPFFDIIQNKYAYLAHDDGWLCRLYCKTFSDFGDLISNKVVDMVSHSRKTIYPFSHELKEDLLKFAEDGLLIDFSHILKTNREIEIPIYCIGKFIDMDEMYNNLSRHINRASYSAKLVHKNKHWIINYVVKK